MLNIKLKKKRLSAPVPPEPPRAVKEMSFIKYSRPREEVEKELLAKYSSTS